MEGLGAAGSIIAIAELSAKVASLCFQYRKDVKHAKEDIIRLRKQVINFKHILENVAQLLDGPNGSKLKASQQLRIAILDGRSQLEELHDELSPKTVHQAMSRLGLRSLKWPFDSKDTIKMVQEFLQCNQTITLALQADQTTILLDVDQKMVLGQLSIAEGASFDSYAEQHNAICLPTTRVDLLKQISAWADDPKTEPVFWLNGMAGTGKSTISRTVAQNLARTGRLGASFFFKRGDGDRASLAKFFTTIAADLVVREPATAAHIKEILDIDSSISQKNAREQFDKLFRQPLVKTATTNASPLVIVVDALDECDSDNDIKLLIHLFSRVQPEQPRPIKIFLTSRPDLPPRLEFQAIKGKYQDIILHEVPQPVIEHDISVFLKHELARIRQEYNDLVAADQYLENDWPGSSHFDKLVKMAVPLFIVAATICRFIGDIKLATPRDQLETVISQAGGHISQLSLTYLPVLKNLIIGKTVKQQQDILRKFHEIVGSIITLASPLSTSALAKILNVPRDNVDSRLVLLHSVFSVPQSPEAPVRLLHLSFRDFLVDPGEHNMPFRIEEKQIHANLTSGCLRVLQFLKEDSCDTRAPGIPRSAISAKQINICLPPEIQYACLYWVYHLEKAGSYISDGTETHVFLTHHFLHWIEALALIGRATESLDLVTILQSRLEAKRSTALSQFLNDARQFLRTYMSVINSTPLQLYSSLLLFAPKRSEVRNTFQEDKLNWICLKPNMDNNWNQCVQTLEGHHGWVCSVAFSPDSKFIASASRDKTVRVWCANTGECTQTLKGHSGSVLSIVISPSSALIASASDDKTIRIWRADMGECTQILKGYNGSGFSVAFSPDSALVASKSDYQTISIWCANTGECVQTLKGHSDSILSIAISPSSTLVASASDDKTIRIWRADIGECTQILKAGVLVCSVAFSPDLAFIVSAYIDDLVRIWRLDTGECVQIIKGHDGSSFSVAFSPDSALVASASDYQTISIWCANTGECVQTLKGHSDSIQSIAFSPDSAFIASASNDQTVRIWRAHTGESMQTFEGWECIRTFEGHHSRVQSVVFSPDSALIASASHGKTIQIWRANTGECIQTLEGHHNWVPSVVFSSDSPFIESSSNANMKWNWRDHTGEIIHMFKGGESMQALEGGGCVRLFGSRHRRVPPAPFSPDSALVASTFFSTTVRIWRADTGECIQTNKFRRTSGSLSFTLDNSHLLTDAGAIPVDSITPMSASDRSDIGFAGHDEIRCSNYGVSSDQCWITLNGHKLLWLPVEYRPESVAISGPTVVLGSATGNVSIIRFAG